MISFTRKNRVTKQQTYSHQYIGCLYLGHWSCHKKNVPVIKMADNNICLLVWCASWPVTPHTIADVQLKQMGNADAQAVKTSTSNSQFCKRFVKIGDLWKWVTGPYVQIFIIIFIEWFSFKILSCVINKKVLQENTMQVLYRISEPLLV